MRKGKEGKVKKQQKMMKWMDKGEKGGEGVLRPHGEWKVEDFAAAKFCWSICPHALAGGN